MDRFNSSAEHPLPSRPFQRPPTPLPRPPALEQRRISLPGKPHEDDGLRSNSTSFLISGFPSGISEKDLWQIVHPACCRSCRLINVIIPNRLDKVGQRFGFLVVRDCLNQSLVTAGLKLLNVNGLRLKAAVARSKPINRPVSPHHPPRRSDNLQRHPNSRLPLPPPLPTSKNGLSKVRTFAQVVAQNTPSSPILPP